VSILPLREAHVVARCREILWHAGLDSVCEIIRQQLQQRLLVTRRPSNAGRRQLRFRRDRELDRPILTEGRNALLERPLGHARRTLRLQVVRGTRTGVLEDATRRRRVTRRLELRNLLLPRVSSSLIAWIPLCKE